MDKNFTPTPHAATIILLLELRRRLLICLTTFISSYVVFYLYFPNTSYQLPAKILLTYLIPNLQYSLPHLTQSYLLQTQAAFWKIIFLTTTLVTAPIFFYQLWAFIADKTARPIKNRWAFPIYSTCLLYLGIAFACLLILPHMVPALLRHPVPMDSLERPYLEYYFNRTILCLLFFGTLFQYFIIIPTLVSTRTIRLKWLRKKRSHFILGSCMISILIAPLSLCIMLYMCSAHLLFESALWIARSFKTKAD